MVLVLIGNWGSEAKGWNRESTGISKKQAPVSGPREHRKRKEVGLVKTAVLPPGLELYTNQTTPAEWPSGGAQTCFTYTMRPV